MASPSPVRAALPVLVLALVLLSGVAAVFIALGWNDEVREQASLLADETGLFLAAVESGAPSLQEMAERYFEGAGMDSLRSQVPSLYVVDRDGEAQLIYRPATGGLRDAEEAAVDWRMHLASAEAEPVQSVTIDEQPYLLSMRSARNGRAFLSLVTPVVEVPRGPVLGLALAMVLGGWLLLGGAFWVVLRHSTGKPLARASELARELASYADEEPDPATLAELQTSAEQEVGPVAEPLFLMANSLGVLRNQRDEARSHLNALFQVHTSYVLLVSLDGTIVDANPAFYAVSGLPHETVRGAPITMLEEIMPLEPVLKLAKRSRSEGAAFADIDYAIKAHDDTTRPLKLSLLAVRSDGHPAVLVVAADKMKERTLERQIDSFSDSLDLMVDKRVEELASSHERIDTLVASTGAVLMAFDRTGSTRRWNDAAERITGLSLAEMSHLDALLPALGLSEEEQTQFGTWLFGDEATPCVVTVHAGTSDEALYAWRRAHVDIGDQHERRVLVGIALPPPVERPSPPPEPAAPAVPQADLEAIEALSDQLEVTIEALSDHLDAALDAQSHVHDRLRVLAAELGAPIDSMRTYSLRIQGMPDQLPAEAQTCLQMIDGAVQMVETIVGRATEETALPDSTSDSDATSGDSLPDSFLSGDMLATPISTTPVENS